MEGKRAWLYCRTAYPDGTALAAQEMSLRGYAEKHGFAVAGVISEQASGLDYSREGLMKLFCMADAGEIDFLLIADISRLGRVPEKTDICLRWLEDRFVEVICADGSVPQTSTEILVDLLRKNKYLLNMVYPL